MQGDYRRDRYAALKQVRAGIEDLLGAERAAAALGAPGGPSGAGRAAN